MTKSTDGRDPDYEVGYARPPVRHRFQKGQSGNPKGKTPGRKSLKVELLEELGTLIDVTDGGRRRKLSKLVIIVKRMVSDAAKGDARAREQLMRLIGEIEKHEPQAAPANSPGTVKDTEILNRFKRELIRNTRGDSNE